MTVYYCGSDGRVRGLGDNELIHFNHNHDRLGRFARSNGSSGGASKAQIKQANITVRKSLKLIRKPPNMRQSIKKLEKKELFVNMLTHE